MKNTEMLEIGLLKVAARGAMLAKLVRNLKTMRAGTMPRYAVNESNQLLSKLEAAMSRAGTHDLASAAKRAPGFGVYANANSELGDIVRGLRVYRPRSRRMRSYLDGADVKDRVIQSFGPRWSK